ncbi:MAG: outer membrane protein transport protein [Chitinophagales bacterium]
MKKSLVIFGLLVLLIHKANAQTDVDALRYATPSLQGTARNIGVGNTLSTVGADISNTHNNPAGLAKFSSTEITLSPGISFYKSNSNYLENNTNASKVKFQVSNLGVVIASRNKRPGNDEDKKWNGIKVGLSFARLANYNENYFFNGYNNKNSLLNSYWEKLADRSVITNDNDAKSKYPFDASIAYQLDLITIDSLGNTFTATNNGNMQQEYSIQKTGGMDELAFGFASEYNSKFSIGASLGIPFINYTERIKLTETDTRDSAVDLNSFSNETYLKTRGVGFNVKIGMFYSPVKNLKLSLAFQTPGFFFMKDQYKTTMEADYASRSDILVGESPDGRSSYKYVQPWRLNAGASYVHKVGFVAFEYELSDAQMSKFRLGTTDGNYENFLNTQIKNKYGLFHTIKAGVEFKVQKFRLRAGVQYRTSPFDKSAAPTTIKTDVLTYSGGLGYRMEHFFIDLTYVQTNTKELFVPYAIDTDFWHSEVPVVTLKIKKPAIFFTVGYKL